MTKKISLITCITIYFIMIFYYSAAAGVKGSKHDFSMYGTSGFSKNYKSGGVNITEVCVFCHTPHGASTAPAYKTDGTSQVLWNRIMPVAAGTTNDKDLNYILYSSPTFTKITLAAPTGTSLMCLSCHDGVTSMAVGTLLNAPGSGNPAVSLIDTGLYDTIGQLPLDFGGPINIGGITTVPWNTTDKIDLSNDHPVSFPWRSDFPGVEPVPTNTKLKLFGAAPGRMECSTCHDVHNNQYPPFLRMSNNNSDMCLACHIK